MVHGDNYVPWNWRGPIYHAPWSMRSINPLEDTRDIQVEDIAQSLAMENRFNGCTYLPYSVASHCLNCVQYARRDTRDPELLLNILLHDAEEAVFRDMPTWLKRMPGMEEAYHEPAKQFRRKLLECWGVPYMQDHSLVKQADNAVGAVEYTELVINRRAQSITVRTWREAMDNFLVTYFELCSARGKV